jgi:hypothetical protein
MTAPGDRGHIQLVDGSTYLAQGRDDGLTAGSQGSIGTAWLAIWSWVV